MQSRFGYVLAPFCLVAGIGVAIWIGLGAYRDLQNALTWVVVPGTSVLALDQPGRYTIYHEPESVVDGRLYTARDIAGLHVELTGDDGKSIAIVAPGIQSNYTIGGHSGNSVWAFEIATPGNYRLTAAYPGGRDGPQTVLAIGRSFFGRLFSAVFIAIGSVLLGFLVALALVLTTYFRRRRMRQTSQSAPTPF
jgi:hypothetical protein